MSAGVPIAEGQPSSPTSLTRDRGRTQHTPALALFDELNRGVLVAEEGPLHVDRKQPVEILGGRCCGSRSDHVSFETVVSTYSRAAPDGRRHQRWLSSD